MSEVDELLMHMSLADDGQVGYRAIRGISVSVPSCRLTGCPAELSLRRHVAVLADTLRVGGQASTASSIQVPARGARSRIGRDGVVNRRVPGRWTRPGGLGDRGSRPSSECRGRGWGPQGERVDDGKLGDSYVFGEWENSDLSVAYNKLELEFDAPNAKMIVHLMKVGEIAVARC